MRVSYHVIFYALFPAQFTRETLYNVLFVNPFCKASLCTITRARDCRIVEPICKKKRESRPTRSWNGPGQLSANGWTFTALGHSSLPRGVIPAAFIVAVALTDSITLVIDVIISPSARRELFIKYGFFFVDPLRRNSRGRAKLRSLAGFILTVTRVHKRVLRPCGSSFVKRARRGGARCIM